MSIRNKIIFVCTGNTCRSPIAECLFSDVASSINSKLEVMSAGLFANENNPANEQAKNVLNNCAKIMSHRAKMLTQKMIDESLALIFMTDHHLKIALTKFENFPTICCSISNFSPSKRNISDPFGESFEQYKNVKNEIEAAIPEIMKLVQKTMKVSIGADHGGYILAKKIEEHLSSTKEVTNHGTFDGISVNYPEFAKKVSLEVQSGRSNFGILICKSGIGMSIAANKFNGIRAALAYNEQTAKSAREHNDANILCLGAETIDDNTAMRIVDTFLNTSFAGNRHELRVKQITEIEKSQCKKS